MDLSSAVTGIVDQLNTAGVRATEDARNLNLPAVLVKPPSFSYRYGKPGMDFEWRLWCLVPDTGTSMSLRAVSALLTATQDAIGWQAKEAEPTDIVLADGGTAVGYILTFNESVRQ